MIASVRFPAALLPLILLAACMPDSQPALHEIVLYGAQNERISYFYGAPTALGIGDETVALSRGVPPADDPLALPEALALGDRPYLRERVQPLDAPPTMVRRVPATSDLRVEAYQDTGPVLYYDGEMWFTLLADTRAGVDSRVVPKPRINRLRGLGELSTAEARALADLLEAGGPVVVTFLDEIPAPRRSVEGLTEYLRTGIYLQRDIGAAPAAVPTEARSVVWEVLASGQQATGFDEASFFLVDDETRFRELWNRAHGGQLQVPPLPPADFERETVLALFQGTRPTGGYGIEVLDMALEGGELYVDVRFVEPAPGAITTQALTSPWLMARILRGGIEVAWIRDAESGRIIGAAR